LNSRDASWPRGADSIGPELVRVGSRQAGTMPLRPVEQAARTWVPANGHARPRTGSSGVEEARTCPSRPESRPAFKEVTRK
jgi:hypothetical protein